MAEGGDGGLDDDVVGFERVRIGGGYLSDVVGFTELNIVSSVGGLV